MGWYLNKGGNYGTCRVYVGIGNRFFNPPLSPPFLLLLISHHYLHSCDYPHLPAPAPPPPPSLSLLLLPQSTTVMACRWGPHHANANATHDSPPPPCCPSIPNWIRQVMVRSKSRSAVRQQGKHETNWARRPSRSVTPLSCGKYLCWVRRWHTVCALV